MFHARNATAEDQLRVGIVTRGMSRAPSATVAAEAAHSATDPDAFHVTNAAEAEGLCVAPVMEPGRLTWRVSARDKPSSLGEYLCELR